MFQNNVVVFFTNINTNDLLYHRQQEELKYLEFISAVTEDILSRTHISDRFVYVSQPCTLPVLVFNCPCPL